MSKSPSLRRIQADIRELALDPSDRYVAQPMENDMFEWHFTIRGADKTDFEGGIYHGRILLPPEYPLKPPHIMFLTPSGRFETNTKVCLSFSAYHPELWQPAWGIRLILEALISFLPTPADGAIGALDWSSKERKRLAKLSQTYKCPTCCRPGNTNNLTGQPIQFCSDLLPPLKPPKKEEEEEDVEDEGNNDKSKKSKSKSTTSSSRFAKEIAKLQQLQMENEGPHVKKKEEEEKGGDDDNKNKKKKDEKSTTSPSSSAAATSESKEVSSLSDDDTKAATTTTTTTTPVKEKNPTTDIIIDNNNNAPRPSTPADILAGEINLASNVDDGLELVSNRDLFGAAGAGAATAASPASEKQPEGGKEEDVSKPKPTTTSSTTVVEESTTTAATAATTMTTPGPNPNPEANNNAIQQEPYPNDAAAVLAELDGDNVNANNNNDDSFLMDPLLNLMIILLASICYLLLQKYYDLEEELQELRHYVEEDAEGGQY